MARTKNILGKVNLEWTYLTMTHIIYLIFSSPVVFSDEIFCYFTALLTLVV